MQSLLKPRVGLLAIVALGLGTAVGVSLFSVMAPAAAVAGPAMLPAIAIAAVPFFIIAVTYAFMGSALPVTGASYYWPSRFIHPFVGFIITWLGIAGSISALHVLGLVLVHYLALQRWLPDSLSMFFVFVAILGINLVGVHLAARVQTILLGLLLLALAIFVVCSYPDVAISHLPHLSHLNWRGAFSAVPLLVGLFMGIEASTDFGEEIESGKKNIPVSIAISIISAAGLYLIVTTVVLGILGSDTLARSSAPLADAAFAAIGPKGKMLIVTAAAIAMGKSLNVIFMLFARSLFAMGRDGVLPKVLGRVHAKTGAPYVAILVTFLFCVFGLALPPALTFLFLAVNVPSLLKQMATCVSAIRLLKLRPDLYEKAHFKLRGMGLWAAIGAISAACVVLLGFGTDWRPYVALFLWCCIGAAYYALNSQREATALGNDPLAETSKRGRQLVDE